MDTNRFDELMELQRNDLAEMICTLEEKLKVAVEALEKYRNIVSEYRSGGDEWAAKEALEKIKAK